jgi:acetyl esterase/lipase
MLWAMSRSARRLVLAASVACAAAAAPAGADAPPVEKNVVYGMHSGLALLLDVHRPERSNGYGIVQVAGSGWQAPDGYDAKALKETQVGAWGPPLLRAGYTVFAINHRAAPRFRYPAALEDVQRAVRFVRHNAGAYGIDPARIGGLGGSSGAHLVGLVAMLRWGGVAGAAEGVDSEPATLQAVVVRAGRFNMTATPAGEAAVAFMGFGPIDEASKKAYAAASPITHASAGAPPVLLIHGDADEAVPFEESVAMEKALRAAGVTAELLRVPGGKHGPSFGSRTPDPKWPDYFAATVGWFDRHLKATGARGR